MEASEYNKKKEQTKAEILQKRIEEAEGSALAQSLKQPVPDQKS